MAHYFVIKLKRRLWQKICIIIRSPSHKHRTICTQLQGSFGSRNWVGGVNFADVNRGTRLENNRVFWVGFPTNFTKYRMNRTQCIWPKVRSISMVRRMGLSGNGRFRPSVLPFRPVCARKWWGRSATKTLWHRVAEAVVAVARNS